MLLALFLKGGFEFGFGGGLGFPLDGNGKRGSYPEVLRGLLLPPGEDIQLSGTDSSFRSSLPCLMSIYTAY